MTVKDKITRIISVVLLSIAALSISSSVIFILIHLKILPNINSKGIFETPALVAGYSALIGILTGILGLLLFRFAQKRLNKVVKPSFTVKKAIGTALITLSVIALTYSLYLILYYFDIIPNRNLGFMDISHLVAGIVAAPATVVGTIGLFIYKKSK